MKTPERDLNLDLDIPENMNHADFCDALSDERYVHRGLRPTRWQAAALSVNRPERGDTPSDHAKP